MAWLSTNVVRRFMLAVLPIVVLVSVSGPQPLAAHPTPDESDPAGWFSSRVKTRGIDAPYLVRSTGRPNIVRLTNASDARVEYLVHRADAGLRGLSDSDGGWGVFGQDDTVVVNKHIMVWVDNTYIHDYSPSTGYYFDPFAGGTVQGIWTMDGNDSDGLTFRYAPTPAYGAVRNEMHTNYNSQGCGGSGCTEFGTGFDLLVGGSIKDGGYNFSASNAGTATNLGWWTWDGDGLTGWQVTGYRGRMAYRASPNPAQYWDEWRYPVDAGTHQKITSGTGYGIEYTLEYRFHRLAPYFKIYARYKLVDSNGSYPNGSKSIMSTGSAMWFVARYGNAPKDFSNLKYGLAWPTYINCAQWQSPTCPDPLGQGSEKPYYHSGNADGYSWTLDIRPGQKYMTAAQVSNVYRTPYGGDYERANEDNNGDGIYEAQHYRGYEYWTTGGVEWRTRASDRLPSFEGLREILASDTPNNTGKLFHTRWYSADEGDRVRTLDGTNCPSAGQSRWGPQYCDDIDSKHIERVEHNYQGDIEDFSIVVERYHLDHSRKDTSDCASTTDEFNRSGVCYSGYTYFKGNPNQDYLIWDLTVDFGADDDFTPR